MKQLLEKDEDGINMLLKNVSLPHFYKQKLLYEEISKRKGISLQELALGFLDTNTNVDSIIYGTSDTQHLDEFLNIIHG